MPGVLSMLGAGMICAAAALLSVTEHFEAHGLPHWARLQVGSSLAVPYVCMLLRLAGMLCAAAALLSVTELVRGAWLAALGQAAGGVLLGCAV